MLDSRYVLTWLLGLALVFPTLPTNAGDAVPVMIWGSDESGGSPYMNPLEKTSVNDFKKILETRVSDSNRPILVFVRDTLCVEDIRQHSEGLKDLQNDGSLVHLPSVGSPLSVFPSLSGYNVSEDEKLEIVGDGQVLITEVTDLDAVMATFNMFKESSPNLMGVLTGKSCPFSRSERVRRAVDESTLESSKKLDEPVPVIKTERILLYYASTPTLNITESKLSTSELLEVKQEGKGIHTSPLALNFIFSIKNATSPYNVSVILELNMNSTQYYMAQAYYQDKEKRTRLTTLSYFVFPYNVSYHCSGNVRFYQKRLEAKNRPGVDFLLSDFQIQVDPKNSSFNFAFDCVGFTSAPIWSGIFVTLILAIIMIWGLTMIMDIRTMDRFDDPKGKTITVTASE